MEAWTELKKKLETIYLAEALRGRLEYVLQQSRRGYHIELFLDGESIHQQHFYDFYLNSHMAPAKEFRYDVISDLRDDQYLNPGIEEYSLFRETCSLYEARTPEENLADRDILITLLTILDGRITAEQLLALGDPILRWPPILQYCYYLRTRAEGIAPPCRIIVTDWEWH